MTRVALWVRISTEEQNDENQLQTMREWAERRDWTISTEFVVVASAWRGNHHPELNRLFDAANSGDFDLVAIRDLARMSREGIWHTLDIWRRLQAFGVGLVSLQEPFVQELSASPAMVELLIAITAATNRARSDQISEATKSGMRAARSRGSQIGRPPGSKDSKKRKQRSDAGSRRLNRSKQ